MDSRILRERQQSARADLDRSREEAPFASGAIAAVTSHDTTYPTTAGALFACVPCELDGAEVEGSAPSWVQQTGARIYAFNAGTEIPPEGTKLVANAVGGRWVFRYDIPPS